MIIIPEGFAHGFQAIEKDSELLYLHTAAYAPRFEGGMAWDDPALGIPWPLPITDLSHRDRGHPHVSSGFIGIRL
jgi:dTDP-4-dehydrorhamnose 3,5-epimerase